MVSTFDMKTCLQTSLAMVITNKELCFYTCLTHQTLYQVTIISLDVE